MIEAFMGNHNHSEYSNEKGRDSINRISEMIDYAHELGHKGIAITEHETITSSLEAQKYYFSKKKEKGWEDFKLALGNEIYLCDSSVNQDNKESMIFPHFVLIALDAKGHKQIRELSTRAWMRSFMRNRIMRTPTYYEDLEEIIGKEPGHVVGSTACLGGMLPRMLLYCKENPGKTRQQEQLLYWIDWMDSIFGHGNFFLEMQPSPNEEQIYVNQQLFKISKMKDIPCIITTDSHYLKKEDKKWHSTYLKSQDIERETEAFYQTTYIMSTEEIHEYMDESLGKEVVSECISNTILIYDKVQDYDLRKPLSIPYVPLNVKEPDFEKYNKYTKEISLLEYYYNSTYDCDRHLVRDIINALENDTRLQNKETYDSIQVCLETIKSSSEKMNVRWSAYLLQIADFVKLAWEAGSLVGAGRGSGVGFILLYLLGITQVNPLWETTRTYPWRFLNPERASVLDIDVDICSDKREVVINKFKEVYGADRISKVMTLSREKSRSAILTAARGLGYDSDLANYLSSMIVADRGMLRTLHQMYYGDDEIKPDTTFKTEIDKYPDIRDAAFKFEGLINGVGSHAGGVILSEEPFTEVTALMKTNSGDVITQFDLHMCEDVSLIKVDLLSTEGMTKIRVCLELLLKAGVIKWQGSLKETYEKYIGIYNLERDNLDMWKMLWNHKVLSFFQMEKQSGIQAVALCKPDSVGSLATINSVMRLMSADGDELPLEKYARFKKDISQWYKEMDAYGVEKEYQEILKEILSDSCGICEAQEYLVLLTNHPQIGGFSLAWGDKLRKAVAKKKPEDFEALEKDFFDNAEKKQLNKKFVNYVWNVLIRTQRGYGFNRSHTLAYSLIGLQELNLCYRFPIIYWNTANLIVDAGSAIEDGEDNKGTNYGKIATAISNMQKQGIFIKLPLINQADFGFVPDESTNSIIYSLKAINGIGDDVVRLLMENRPYRSMEDFYQRMIETKLIKKSQMIQLIKAGCFVELDCSDRRKTMYDFLGRYVINEITSLTMSQFNKIIQYDNKYHFILEQVHMAIRHKFFKDYVLNENFLYKLYVDKTRKLLKRGYHDRWFKLDKSSMKFFTEYYSENPVEDVEDEFFIISEKKFLKENDEKIKVLRDWMNDEQTIKKYNACQLMEEWEKDASGTVEKWEMDSLSIYTEKHELSEMNNEKYGVVDFFKQPEEPVAYAYYTRRVRQQINGQTIIIERQFPKNRIVRLAGTVLDKNKDKGLITLLTTTGVVTVKFNKGAFLHYNKQISVVDENGTKNVIEKTWLGRGNKILVCGYRVGNQFRVYNYADSIYKHTCNLITDIQENGDISVQTERTKVEDD